MAKKSESADWTFVTRIPVDECVHRLEEWQHQTVKTNSKSGFVEGKLILHLRGPRYAQGVVAFPIVLKPIDNSTTEITIVTGNYRQRLNLQLMASVLVTMMLTVLTFGYHSFGLNANLLCVLSAATAITALITISGIARSGLNDVDIQIEFEHMRKVVFNPHLPFRKR